MLGRAFKLLFSIREHSLAAFAEEIVCSSVPFLGRRYYRIHEEIIARQYEYIKRHYNLEGIDKVVEVGCGAIPFVPVYLAQHIDKKFFLIEKSTIAGKCAERFLSSIGVGNMHVICSGGEDYSDFDDALVIISLHTAKKKLILDRVLDCPNNLAVLKQPVDEFSIIADRLSEGEIIRLSGEYGVDRVLNKTGATEMIIVDNLKIF